MPRFELDEPQRAEGTLGSLAGDPYDRGQPQLRPVRHHGQLSRFV